MDTAYGDWQTTVEPLVIREIPPPTLEVALKGGAGFFGSLLLGPLLGGGVAGGA